MSLYFLRVIVVVGFSILIAACNSSEGGNSPAPSMVLAPTYYVDPTCGVNGDGTTTTCGIHGPFNSWNNVSPWAAGNIYAGKGGTSETFTTYSIQASGTAGNPITITSYGTGQFTFASTTAVALASSNKSYVIIDNIAVSATTNHCLYFSGVASHVTVKNSTFIQCGIEGQGTVGVTIDAQNATARYTDVTVDNNNFTDITGPAFYMQIINTNNLVWDNIAITNNNMTNVSNGASNSGAIRISMDTGTSAIMTNLIISDNTITLANDELSTSNPSPHVISVRAAVIPINRTTLNLFRGVTITNNTITNGTGGILLSDAGPLSGAPVNTISNNVLTNLYATAAIASFYNSNILIAGNTVTNIYSGPGNGNYDGMGVDFDIGNDHGEVAYNIIQDCVGIGDGEASNTVAELSGEGIGTFSSNTSTIHHNLLIGNRHGILVGDETVGSPGPLVFANNTIVNSTRSAIDLYHFSAFPQVHTFVNNIVAGSALYGFRNLNPQSQMMQTNLFFNNASEDYFQQATHPTDITGSDPLFVGPTDFRLQASSPARAAGTYWGSQCLDQRGRPCVPGQIDLGAYQHGS